MKISNRNIKLAFENAIPHLWDGISLCSDSNYICFAIRTGNHGGWVLSRPNKNVEAAIRVIDSRLEGYEDLDNWLASKGIFADSDEQMQSYRKAWLLKLIDEFSS